MINRQYLAAVMAVVGCAVLLLTPAVAGQPDAAHRGPPFPRIANMYGTNLTPNGARVADRAYPLTDVARYDLLVGVGGSQGDSAKLSRFKEQLTALKKINPSLIALHFACSAPYTHVAPDEAFLSARKPGQVVPWLLQTNGRPIAGWPGTYMLNLTVPAVVDWLANQTLPAVREHGYDGIFIDCLGPHFDRWACEIATGKEYTVDADLDGKPDDPKRLDEAWRLAKTQLARRTRELLGDGPVFMANQAGPSTFDQLNGVYLEDYIDAVLDGHRDWENLLKLYLHWTETPRRPNVTVLGCSSGVEPPFEAFRLSAKERARYLDQGKVKLARMRFGLATTLMGDGYYSFDLNTRWRGQLWWYPEYDAPLGYPTEPCHANPDGTWQRRFEGGLVVVNPTQWDVPVNLNSSHRDASSGRVDKQFVLPRQDGRIYLPSDAASTPGERLEPEIQFSWQGPAGIVERDGHFVVRDGGGLATLLDGNGRILSICQNGRELVVGMRPVIVADKKWRDFPASDMQHTTDHGDLVFTGKRVDGKQTLAFEETVSMQRDRIVVRYAWQAVTGLQIEAFRQAIYLPDRQFAGTRLRWPGRRRCAAESRCQAGKPGRRNRCGDIGSRRRTLNDNPCFTFCQPVGRSLLQRSRLPDGLLSDRQEGGIWRKVGLLD